MVTIILRSALIASLAMACTACWSSEYPLLTSAQSTNPIPDGVYITYDADTNEAERVQLMTIPGGGYVYTNEEEGNFGLPLLVHEFSEDWYLLQLGPPEGMLLAVAHRKPERTDIYDPDCTEAMASISGVTRTKASYTGFDCTFANLDAAVSAGLILKAQVEAGEDPGLSGWFAPVPED